MTGTAPGLPEAIWFKLRGHGDVVQHGVISFFCFGWRDTSDRLQESPVVEPVDPFERGIFDSFKRSPRTSPLDHFGLVKAIDCLGQGIEAPIFVKRWPGCWAHRWVDFADDVSLEAADNLTVAFAFLFVC